MFESMNMTEDADVFFYDRERVRYKHTGEEGQYTYEPVTSILEAKCSISGGI